MAAGIVIIAAQLPRAQRQAAHAVTLVAGSQPDVRSRCDNAQQRKLEEPGQVGAAVGDVGRLEA